MRSQGVRTRRHRGSHSATAVAGALLLAALVAFSTAAPPESASAAGKIVKLSDGDGESYGGNDGWDGGDFADLSHEEQLGQIAQDKRDGKGDSDSDGVRDLEDLDNDGDGVPDVRDKAPNDAEVQSRLPGKSGPSIPFASGKKL